MVTKIRLVPRQTKKVQTETESNRVYANICFSLLWTERAAEDELDEHDCNRTQFAAVMYPVAIVFCYLGAGVFWFASRAAQSRHRI